MRWTLMAPQDERCRPGRRSRVVLTPRRWRQACKAMILRAMVAKKPGSPGRARRKPLKPFAQGVPECFGGPVVTYSCGFFISTRGYGCDRAPGIPCALSFPRDVVSQDPDAMRAAGMRRCVQREATAVIARIIGGHGASAPLRTLQCLNLRDI